MHKHKTISNPGCWSHAKSNPLARPSPYNAKDYKSGGRTTSICITMSFKVGIDTYSFPKLDLLLNT